MMRYRKNWPLYAFCNTIHTLLIQPVMMKGEIKGAFLMGECTGRKWHLNTEEEKELEAYSPVDSDLCAEKCKKRERSGATLQDARLLDDFDSYVMAVDYDTYELCFANRKLLNALPNLQIGDYCYRTYARQDKPCDNCIMKKAGQKRSSCKVVGGMVQFFLRSWLKVHGSWMQNDGNSATCVLNSMDISEYFIGNMNG